MAKVEVTQKLREHEVPLHNVFKRQESWRMRSYLAAGAWTYLMRVGKPVRFGGMRSSVYRESAGTVSQTSLERHHRDKE